MKAVVYARVSTADQSDRGYSLPTQIEACQQYAERAGLEVLEIISEDASGLELARPGLEQARRLLASGQAGAIVVYDPDRLSRHELHYMQLRDEWERAGVQLHYALYGHIDLGDVGQQIAQDVRARIARDEIRKLVERSQRGKRGRVAAGNVITAQRPPFGYRQVEGSLEIDGDEAETVRMIFSLYIDERLSIRSVAERLTALKRPTRADKVEEIHKDAPFGQWGTNTVRTILKRETYTGVWHYGKTRRKTTVVNGRKIVKHWKAPRSDWLAVDVPAIISRQRWEAAQQRIEDNTTYNRRNQRYKYLMARRLTCATCEMALYADTSNSSGKQYQYYRCSSSHADTQGASCGQKGIRAELVDAAAWEWLAGVFKKRELKSFVAGKIAQLLTEIDDQGQRTAKIRRKFERKQDALTNLLKMGAEDEIERVSFDRARAALREELASIQAELEQAEGGAAHKSALERLLDFADEFDQYADTIGPATPYAERLRWVDKLNVRGIIDAAAKTAEFSCDLSGAKDAGGGGSSGGGSEDGGGLKNVILSIEKPLPTKLSHIWEIRQRVTFKKTAAVCV